ncbi:MAG: hypothetical protein KDB07_03535, partial [Planctomycetes bacterium]|nr:hypothetical protein [Planctomycetota bacterium]
WISAGIGVAMFLVIGTAAFIFAEPAAAIFAKSPAVLDAAVTYIRYVSLSLGVGSGAVILALALNGAGSTRAPLVIDFLAFALLILPFAAYSVLVDGSGWESILLAMAGANIVLAIVYALWFRLGRWQRIRV